MRLHTGDGGAASGLNVVMLGPPGAGKGTQAERLAQKRGLPRISTGDILREAVQEGTPLGAVARAAMDAGRLVSDDVMIGIVQERLERADARQGFVLDGFPRTVEQAAALDRHGERTRPAGRARRRGAGGRAGQASGDAAHLRTAAGRTPSMHWTTKCEKCGGGLVARVDDGDEIVRERLKVYQRQSNPLVAYYSARGTLRSIDGNQPADVVTAAVDAAVNAAAAET